MLCLDLIQEIIKYNKYNIASSFVLPTMFYFTNRLGTTIQQNFK